jgi:hypothetical protein
MTYDFGPIPIDSDLKYSGEKSPVRVKVVVWLFNYIADTFIVLFSRAKLMVGWRGWGAVGKTGVDSNEPISEILFWNQFITSEKSYTEVWIILIVKMEFFVILSTSLNMTFIYCRYKGTVDNWWTALKKYASYSAFILLHINHIENIFQWKLSTINNIYILYYTTNIHMMSYLWDYFKLSLI